MKTYGSDYKKLIHWPLYYYLVIPPSSPRDAARQLPPIKLTTYVLNLRGERGGGGGCATPNRQDAKETTITFENNQILDLKAKFKRLLRQAHLLATSWLLAHGCLVDYVS